VQTPTHSYGAASNASIAEGNLGAAGMPAPAVTPPPADGGGDRRTDLRLSPSTYRLSTKMATSALRLGSSVIQRPDSLSR
jgi:hypothetical protein